MEREFIIGGRRLRVTSEEVIRKLRGVEPNSMRKHAVEVHGELYPIKQAFSVVTGLDLLDFTTNQARRVFVRLGFPVKRMS